MTHPGLQPNARALRIPAKELDTLVLQHLQQLLGEPLALLDALSRPDDDAGLLQGLLTCASARYQAWQKLSPEQVRQFVRAVIVRISVTPERIVIALNKRVLRCALLPAATHSASAASRDDEDELLQLTIDARLQRRGREVRLLVSPRAGAALATQEDRALMELLAQGRRWLEQWLHGEVASLRALAKAAGKSERQVSRMVHTAFLAPDLVEAVLAGRQSSQLTARHVMKQFPWDWGEQRRRFAVASDVTDRLTVRDSPASVR